MPLPKQMKEKGPYDLLTMRELLDRIVEETRLGNGNRVETIVDILRIRLSDLKQRHQKEIDEAYSNGIASTHMWHGGQMGG